MSIHITSSLIRLASSLIGLASYYGSFSFRFRSFSSSLSILFLSSSSSFCSFSHFICILWAIAAIPAPSAKLFELIGFLFFLLVISYFFPKYHIFSLHVSIPRSQIGKGFLQIISSAFALFLSSLFLFVINWSFVLITFATVALTFSLGWFC